MFSQESEILSIKWLCPLKWNPQVSFANEVSTSFTFGFLDILTGTTHHLLIEFQTPVMTYCTVVQAKIFWNSYFPCSCTICSNNNNNQLPSDNTLICTITQITQKHRTVDAHTCKNEADVRYFIIFYYIFSSIYFCW